MNEDRIDPDRRHDGVQPSHDQLLLYRRAVHDRLGPYREDLPVMGDWEFGIRLVTAYDIGVIAKPLANYHRRIGAGDAPAAYANTVTSLPGLHAETDALLRNELCTRNGPRPDRPVISWRWPHPLRADRLNQFHFHDIRACSTGISGRRLPRHRDDGSTGLSLAQPRRADCCGGCWVAMAELAAPCRRPCMDAADNTASSANIHAVVVAYRRYDRLATASVAGAPAAAGARVSLSTTRRLPNDGASKRRFPSIGCRTSAI